MDGNNLVKSAGVFLFTLWLSCFVTIAQPSPGVVGPIYTPLDTWSFYDNTNWTSDLGFSPITFTNLGYSILGNGQSLSVDSNVPAWLNYNIVETNGTTNLTVETGTVMFWFAPDWASTNLGGTGPGGWAQLLNVGEWTPDASNGYWGLMVDPPGENLGFESQDGLGNSYVISTPISWTNDYFHFIVLTYSSTNVSLYLDGMLATNDPGGLGLWPGPDVLANGFFIGSDTNGLVQSHGLFNDLFTYNVPLDPGFIANMFAAYDDMYFLNPINSAMLITSANSNPSTTVPDAITGAGNLQWDGTVAIITNANPYVVWLTNVTATAAGGGTENVTFTIQGGQPGYYYDVFATGALELPLPNALWFWMGQGNSGNTYTLPVTSGNAFLILGTPQDSSGAELTDTYQLLVSKTNPNVTDSDLDGVPTGWDVLLGLNPQTANFTSSSERANYSYTPADWLSGVSGIRSGSVTNDAEGNVLQVSQ